MNDRQLDRHHRGTRTTENGHRARTRGIAGIEGIPAPATATRFEPPAKLEVPARKGKKRSAAFRKRMKEAQRLRWAKIRGESEPVAPAVPEPSKPKRRISAQGMKRIIAATKKRWRLQKAAAKLAPAKNAALAVKKSAPAPALALAQTAG